MFDIARQKVNLLHLGQDLSAIYESRAKRLRKTSLFKQFECLWKLQAHDLSNNVSLG
jgi:hypothetical protein